MIAKKHIINWNDLRFFLAVANQGTLSGAARELSVNHTTVFRRINHLEDNSGVRLFERLRDGYHLTQAGEDMLVHVERIRDEVDLLSLEVVGRDFQPSGIVRITAPDSLACHYINRYIVEFCELYPRIDVELIVSNQDLDLTKRETDIAIRATSKPPDHLIARKIFSLAWAFYVSQEYVDQYSSPSTMDKLKEHQLIGPDSRYSRLPAFVQLEKLQSPEYRLRANSLTAMASLAQAGNGIALLPDDQAHLGMVRLFELTPRITSEVWVLVHPELRATQRIRLLMDFLVDKFRSDELLTGLAH